MLFSCEKYNIYTFSVLLFLYHFDKKMTSKNMLVMLQKREHSAYWPGALFWCGKRELNPYGVNHTPLKRARLPVPPLPRVR